MTEPMSAAESARRFETLEKGLRDLFAEVKADRMAHEQTYVRKDIYETRHREIRDDIAELKSDRKEDAKWRRQVALGIVVMAIPLVITTAIAIFNLIRGSAA